LTIPLIVNKGILIKRIKVIMDIITDQKTYQMKKIMAMITEARIIKELK